MLLPLGAHIGMLMAGVEAIVEDWNAALQIGSCIWLTIKAQASWAFSSAGKHITGQSDVTRRAAFARVLQRFPKGACTNILPTQVRPVS